jgi:hypothetical protein
VSFLKDVLQVPENALIVFVRHHTVHTGEQVLRPLCGQKRPLISLAAQRLLSAYSVEKLCFENRRDLICDLSSVSYASYEGVAEVA